jgi:hypothetical protein
MRPGLMLALAATVALSGAAGSPALGPPPVQAPPPPPVYRIYPPHDAMPVARSHSIRKAARPIARRRLAALPPPAFKDHARSLTISAPVLKCCSSASEAMKAISRDPTLQAGDFVMTERGLKMFVGSPAFMHSPREFVALARSRDLPSELRQLAGLKDYPLREARKSQVTPEYESAYSLRTLDQDEPRKVIDARGRLLRLVGGYAPLAQASNNATD